ncbi:MAG: dihydrodipicolinate synthase family protein [Gammaproteobacteria bacterium]|nr:dihydrodipicolinate synthase family protein [Gammaproteobacteria bacterium]
MSQHRFSGVLAPVITPYNADLSPDAARLGNHCSWLVSQGAGLAVFGTNSEANSLSIDEKSSLLEALIEAGIDTDKLMPGTGCCALSDSITLTKKAVDLGCAGVLMLPPFYYKGVSDQGLFDFYANVIEAVADDKLHIYLYHIPPISQIPLSLNLIEQLAAKYPDTIAGIKDSSGDWNQTQAFHDLQIENFAVFCGSESFLLQNMVAGGAGCISATANVNPHAIFDLYYHWNEAGSAKKQSALNSIREIFQSFPMIPALKAATAIYGDDAAWMRVRPPLTGLTDKQHATLALKLKKAGFEMPDL